LKPNGDRVYLPADEQGKLNLLLTPDEWRAIRAANVVWKSTRQPRFRGFLSDMFANGDVVMADNSASTAIKPGPDKFPAPMPQSAPVGIIPGSLREARSLVLPAVCDALGRESFDGLEVQGHRLVLLWPNGPTLLLTQSELATGWHETFWARLANAQQYAKHKAKQITEAMVERLKAWEESGMATQPEPMPQSAQTSMIVDELTDKILGLINSKPRSPTKDEIAEVIKAGIGKLIGGAQNIADELKPVDRIQRVYCGPHHASDGTGAQTIGMVYPDGWHDQDGKVAAFARFVQFQGPPQRYYELGRGDQKVRYEYQTFAWWSKNPARIVARMAALGDEIEKLGGEIIVWRSPPELTVDAGVYRFFCRFLLMPYIQIDGAKPEGAETPEA
jgi:hypothetical protein